MRRDLDLAAQMQSMLFPIALPDNARYQLCATYLPASGSWRGLLRFPPPSTGMNLSSAWRTCPAKGIPAALLCSNFQANLHAHVPIIPSLVDLVNVLNEKCSGTRKGEVHYVFIGRYNCKTRELQYVNAGHNPPLLLHEKVVLFDRRQYRAGHVRAIAFRAYRKVFIPENAFLHLYTDGVTDVENPAGEEFSTDRLKPS